MIGIIDYLNFAKTQNRILNRVEGIMICYPKFGPIPQDEAWATYVAITFDVTEIENSEDNIMLSADKFLPIVIRDYKTAIRLKDLPDRIGRPKLFEPIFW